MQILFKPGAAFRLGAAVIGTTLILAPARASGTGVHASRSDIVAFGEPGSATAVGREVRIRMNDMSFTPASVTVRAGETVRFVIANTSGIDHDFTLGDPNAQTAHRAAMAAQAEAGSAYHKHEGNAVLVRAGSTGMLVWKFAGPGRLEFDCNLPGHYEAGMRGVLDVRPKR